MNLPKGSDFQPPWPLRSGHIQTMLSSSGIRRRLLPRRAHRVQEDAQEVLIDVGHGDRLSGRFTAQRTGRESRGLAILFHGWEGSVDSTYVLQTGSRLLEDGWDIFRLNFRDHGDSHGLNEALFHSCRIDEVVAAMGEIARMFPAKVIAVAGFSLGVPLDYVLAVCPIVDPSEGLFSLESEAPWFYQAYFMQKWRRSLRLKQQAFPHQTYFELDELRQNMRDLTRSLVLRHTDFGSLEAYLDGYSVAGDRLMDLHLPATILTSRDDPVIPVAAFDQLRVPPNVELDIATYGGHCGFIRDYGMTSFTDDYIAARFDAITR